MDDILLTVERVRRGTRNRDVLDLCDWIELRLRQMPLPLEAPAAETGATAPAPRPTNPMRKNQRQTTGSAATNMHRPAKGSSRPSRRGGAPATDPKPGFDKRTYQRDYMRDRREKAKEGKGK